MSLGAALLDCRVQRRRLRCDKTPQSVCDRAMRRVAPPRRDDLAAATTQMSSGDRQQAAIAQLVGDHEAWHVAPPHALQNDLLLHLLIAHRPCPGALDQIIVAGGPPQRRIADDALHMSAHLLGRDRFRNGKRQEIRRHDRKQRVGKQIDEFEPRIAFVDVVDNEVRLIVEQPLRVSGQPLKK